MKPSIVSLKGEGMISICGVCDEIGWVVAKDTATDWDICPECVHDALTLDCFLVNNSKLLKIRHPKPKEFRGVNDH